MYTLDTVKVDMVKLPTFEGRDDEDFAKFKEQVKDAFVQNRTQKKDKLAKLREVLRGHAKALVPFLITNSIHIVPVASLEHFRAQKCYKLEYFRAL